MKKYLKLFFGLILFSLIGNVYAISINKSFITNDELTEKKSRFIAYVFRIKNEEDANIKIEMIKKKN